MLVGSTSSAPRSTRLPPHVLRVDERRLAADRDRFLERADLQVRVHGRGEPAVSTMPSRLNELKPAA